MRGVAPLYELGIERSAPDEAVFLGLMRSHLALARHAEGLRIYERCRSHLKEQWDVAPSAETERVRSALLAQTGD